MAKKQYTFHIDTTATIQAESKEEAKKELIQELDHWAKGVAIEDRTIADGVLAGSQVGEVVQTEKL